MAIATDYPLSVFLDILSNMITALHFKTPMINNVSDAHEKDEYR